MKKKEKMNTENEELLRSENERKTVDRLVKEEKAAEKANKVKYAPDSRTVTIIVTCVLCFLLVLGGIFMINYLKKSDKYNSGNEVFTPGPSSSSETRTSSASVESVKTEPEPTIEETTAESEDSGYHPIPLPETSATTAVTSHNISVSEPAETEASDTEPAATTTERPPVPEKTTAATTTATRATTTQRTTTAQTYTMNAPSDTVSPPTTTFAPDDDRHRDFESGLVTIASTTGTYDISGWDIFE